MYQVKDAMSRDLVAIDPDATVSDAIELLLDKDISGVPVLDKRGSLVGMITQFQLLEVLYDPELRSACVRDFMSRDMITVEETDLLSYAASKLILHRIRRLPVLHEGRLVGIVSRGDLLGYFRQSGRSINQFFGELREWQEDETAELAACNQA